jgi:predicted DNA-binding transcriptional regulator AlpA
MLSNMVRVCEYCSYEFPEPIKLGPSKGVMVEITPIHLKGRKVANISVEELIELQQSGKYKPTFIWRVVRSKNELEKYASLMGYSSGWVWRQKTQGSGHFTNYTI